MAQNTDTMEDKYEYPACLREIIHPRAQEQGYKRTTNLGLIFIPEPDRASRVRQCDRFIAHYEKLQGLRDLLQLRTALPYTIQEQQNLQWEMAKLYAKADLWVKEYEVVQIEMDW
ncbi:MAG: hypothetical protein Q9209_006471 [Squamulea sp. 1 TL-2023]